MISQEAGCIERGAAGAIGLPAATPAASVGRLSTIQAARGAAALLVVVYHFSRLMQPEQYLGAIAFGNVFAFGHAGVDFFFVLSGFIIYSVHRGDIGRPARFRNFAWRRASRVYPSYWAVTALVVLSTALVAANWTERFSAWHVVGSLLLVPQPTDPVLAVGWTLVHEACFYLAFGIAILSRRAGLLVAAAWLALIAAGLFSPMQPWPLQFLASAFNLQFAMGLVAAHVVLTGAVPAPRALAAAGACAFGLVAYAENTGAIALYGAASKVLFGLSATAVVIGLAAAERAGTLRAGRVGVFLGDISYSLYLIHILVIADGAWLLSKAGVIQAVPAPALAAGMIGACVAAAFLLHLAVERPLMLRPRRGLRAPRLGEATIAGAVRVPTGT